MIMDSSDYLMEDMARQGSNGVKLELNDRFSFNERMIRKHKCSSPLNFATSVEDYEMHGPPTKKPKTPRDPMSHRIIEKRRRDRMNNCLADLSRLIPANYMKQGQGRIEKTEIIEMAIRHIKHLQNIHRSLVNQGQCCAEKFYLGFKECEAETIRYFVECEGLDNKDQFFMRVISHLEAVSKKHLSTGTQNCADFPKEESSSGDKTNISCSSLNSECENSKLKSNERTPQTVPEMLASSHDSINSAASKQLRSLLSQGNSGFEQPDSGNASCADSLGIFSSSESSISGNNADEANMNMTNSEGDLHYHGNTGSENGSSSGSSKENKFTNYKFKHDITKRFSEQEKYSVDLSASLTQENIIEHQENHNYEKHGYEKHSKDKHGYDKHSHDKHSHDKHSHDKHSHDKHSHDKHSHDKHSHDKHSHDKHGYDKHSHDKHGYDKHGFEKHEKLSSKLKRKIMRSTSPSSCSDSTAYPTSEHSSNGASNTSPTMMCRSPEDETVNNGVHLPAFVLHPQGTHYLPLTIQQSCFQNSLQQQERTQQPIVFHPISILVNFAAPGLVIQNAESFVNNSGLDVTFSSSSSSTSASAAAAANAAAAAPQAENGNSNNGHTNNNNNNDDDDDDNNNNLSNSSNNNCPNSVINKSPLSMNCTPIISPFNINPVNTSHNAGSSNSNTSSSNGNSCGSITAANNNNNNNNNTSNNSNNNTNNNNNTTIPHNAIQPNNHISPVKHGNNNTEPLNSGPVVVNSSPVTLSQTSSASTPTVTTATALLQTPTAALITPGIVGTGILHTHPQQQQQQHHPQQQQQQQHHPQQQQQQQQQQQPPQLLPIHQTHIPHIHSHQPPPATVLSPQQLQPHQNHHHQHPNQNANSSSMIHMEHDNRNNNEVSIPIGIPNSSCYQSL